MLKGCTTEWRKLLSINLNIVYSKLADCSNYIPDESEIFSFGKYPICNIKAIILGQDPYPNAHAHGIAFSSKLGMPASLRNILKTLLAQQKIFEIPEIGDLTPWCEQGILLLNTSLTVIEGKPNSCKHIWLEYCTTLLKNLVTVIKQNVVVCLWGNEAKKYAEIFNKPNFTVLTHCHPSPLNGKKFLSCTHFDKIDINYNLITYIFTDGSCYPNKKSKAARAGYSVVVVRGKQPKIYAGSFKTLYDPIYKKSHYASSQRAEGTAIYMALQITYIHKYSNVVIVTDSEFWIRMINVYMPNWIKNEMPFDEKKNSDLTTKITHMINKIDTCVEFRHIKSHNKSGWGNKPLDSYEYFCYKHNELADRYAGWARTNKLKYIEERLCLSNPL